jgi:hypothetical protein
MLYTQRQELSIYGRIENIRHNLEITLVKGEESQAKLDE